MKIEVLLSVMRDNIANDPSDWSKEISLKEIENIKKIQEICNAQYYNQLFYGNTALNRKILLDSTIAQLLTPNTILAMLWLHTRIKKFSKKDPIAIYRNSTGYISLVSAIYYGFKEGLDTIELMPNNEPSYDHEKYRKQKIDFSQNTNLIIKNIKKAAELLDIHPEDQNFQDEILEEKSLTEIFTEVTETIDKIKKSGKSNQLLYVPGYKANDIRNQSVSGFTTICQLLKINYHINADGSITLNAPLTMEELVNQFLSSEEAMLHGSVIHLFYDRVHLEACLEQEKKIIIGNETYLLKDILQEMVKQCDTNDSIHHVAKEQFSIRLKLVSSHLNEYFCDYHPDYQPETEHESPIGYIKIKKLIIHIEKNELWTCKDYSKKLAELNFLRKMIEEFDIKMEEHHSDQFPVKIRNPRLSECLASVREKNPAGYSEAVKRKGLLFCMLSEKGDEELLQGPRVKTEATRQLEELVQLLLSNYKSMNCFFNSLNELEIVIDSKLFNITQILHHEPDFSQLTLEPAHLSKYACFAINAKHKPTIGFWKIPTELDYKNRDKYNECEHLHYGEKLAITFYTSVSFYHKIQEFLRSSAQSKNLQSQSFKNLNHLVPEILLGASVAAHGLAKVPNTIPEENIPYNRYYRYEHGVTSAEFFKNRLAAQNTQESLIERGFVSTSTGCGFKLGLLHNINTVVYENAAINPLGKKVKALSKVPIENEVLYPPGTQFQYTDYMENDNNHFFCATPIRSLNGIRSNDYSPQTVAYHELEIIDKMLEHALVKNQHTWLRQLFDTVSNDEKLDLVSMARSATQEILKQSKPLQSEGYEICLDQEMLTAYKDRLKELIDKNRELVESASLPASLGKTNNVLVAALHRITERSNAIMQLELQTQDPLIIEEVNPVNPSFP